MSSESTTNRRTLGASWLPGQFRGLPVYEAVVFLVSLTAFSTVVPFGGFDTIIGDNIAQVAYWRILFHHGLAGSLGASSMKPGLILSLGSAHDLSLALFGSPVLVKSVFALAGAGLATIVARIARETGGNIAGVGAAVYMMTGTPVPEMFKNGTSMIVFFPLLLCGVWLFSRGRETAGACVLCLAALIRIEAFAVLLWLALAEQLFKQRLRAFLVSSLAVSAALAVTVLVYYRVQGSFARFNAGGPPLGYLFARNPSVTGRFADTLRYAVDSSATVLMEDCGFPYLGIPALIGCALSPARRFYVSLLGIPLFLIVYISAGQGSPELRYFQFLTPFAAGFGAAGIAQGFRVGERWRTKASSRLLLVLAALGGVASFSLGGPKVLCSLSLFFIAAGLSAVGGQLPFALPPSLIRSAWALLLAAALLSALQNHDWGRPATLASYTVDAKSLVEKSPVPRGKRVLTEDDLLYGVLVRDWSLFRSASTLQYFNVQEDARRAEILGSTDYIIVSKGRHSFYYLRYDPLRRSTSDPFRAAIMRAQRSREPSSVYGHRLVPIENSRSRIVLRVESDGERGL